MCLAGHVAARVRPVLGLGRESLRRHDHVGMARAAPPAELGRPQGCDGSVPRLVEPEVERVLGEHADRRVVAVLHPHGGGARRARRTARHEAALEIGPEVPGDHLHRHDRRSRAGGRPDRRGGGKRGVMRRRSRGGEQRCRESSQDHQQRRRVPAPACPRPRPAALFGARAWMSLPATHRSDERSGAYRRVGPADKFSEAARGAASAWCASWSQGAPGTRPARRPSSF